MFRSYDESLFEQDLAKCLEKATNNYCNLKTPNERNIAMTAGFQVANVDDKIKLRVHLDRYRNREYKETPLLLQFSDIAHIVGKSCGNDPFKASLLIIYDVLMRKEQERKAPEFTHTSQHRDGMDVLNFFFDLINHISGYTEKYFDEVIEKIDHEGLIQKYRAEKAKYESKINESPLLGDRYPHSILVIESAQEFLRMQDGSGKTGKGNLAVNYLDTLILRLTVRFIFYLTCLAWN